MPIGSHHRPRVRAPRALAILALLVPLAVPASALAATPSSGTVTPTAPFTWQGPVATGQNQAYDPGTGEPLWADRRRLLRHRARQRRPGRLLCHQRRRRGVQHERRNGPRDRHGPLRVRERCERCAWRAGGRVGGRDRRRARVRGQRDRLLPGPGRVLRRRPRLGLHRSRRVLQASEVPTRHRQPRRPAGLPGQQPGPGLPVALRAAHRPEPAEPEPPGRRLQAVQPRPGLARASTNSRSGPTSRSTTG